MPSTLEGSPREQSFPKIPWLGSVKQPWGTCPWPARVPHYDRNGPVVI